MEEHTYYISEVSKLVGVEPHVLRYWEEELDFSIRRNEQGKRCYTQADVARFREAKRWKDKGMQLKAVKELLEEGPAIPFGGADHIPAAPSGETGQVPANPSGKTDQAPADPSGETGQAPASPSGETDQVPASPSGETGQAPADPSGETGQVPANPSGETDSDQPEEEASAPEYEVVSIEPPSDSMKKFERLLDSLITRALERNNEKLIQEICDEILQRADQMLAEKARELAEQELMREMLREGERESAAAKQRRESFWKRWKRRFLNS